MNEEDQHEEEYKQQALLFKDQGNEAFQAGNVDLAIQYFTQAISIDPDNHIVYSNRSAAYMKINHISKALHDAEICVELAPNWSKGYNRLGTAQQGLKRFDAAIQSFKKGIELDPNNPALWSCLKLCEKAYEKDKEERFKKAEFERQLEEERLKRREDAKNQILKNSKKNDEENLLDDFFDDIGTSSKPSEKEHHEPHIQDAKADEEDNLLASFFSDVTNPNSTSKEAPKKTESDIIESFDNKEGGEEEEKTILTEKYVKQPLGSSQEVVDRLLCPFHEWKNLNPYHVFSLDIDATDEDIKFRYKKLSLKVHPDRCRGIENAREAFELVKAAYEKLMDEDQRKTVIAHIENVTNEVNKGRKKIIKEKGISEEDLPDYEQERQRKIMKHFADLEQMRRVSEKNKRVYSAREKEQENEEVEKAQKFEEFEKEWSEENRREHRVGNWRDFQHAPPSKKLKATNYKEESREEKKFGQVQLESWKKSWK